jgi:tetratricopeptide (TPR) repeat protein
MQKIISDAIANLKGMSRTHQIGLVAIIFVTLVLFLFPRGGSTCSSEDTIALVRQIIRENWNLNVEGIESIRTVDTIRANGGYVCQAVANNTVQGPYGGMVSRNITYSIEPTSKSGEIFVSISAFTIASTRNDANEPNSRGNAHFENKEYDNAIADYNEAIKHMPKYAISYLNRGNAYHAKGDNDRALIDYNEAIQLDPEFTQAYFARGSTYLLRKDYDRALADYNEAVRLDPNNAVAYYVRGAIYLAKKEYSLAIADCVRAAKLGSKLNNEIDTLQGLAYFGRGRRHLLNGFIAYALADLKQANELNPKEVYTALWLDIADRRNNNPSRLTRSTIHFDMKVWPAPIVRLFLGEITPDEVLAAANSADSKTKQGQVCEANFYSGEFALFQNAKSDAQRLFQLAASGCPEDFVEREEAIAELKVLGAGR